MLRDDEKMITDEKNLVQLFNDYYINTVERSCGFKPEKVEFDTGSSNKNEVLSTILDKYRNHPSIVKILKNRNSQSSSISIPSSSWGSNITTKEINTILKSLDSKKAPGIDKTPTKLVKLASDILAEPLPIAINNSISTSTFPNNPKIASVVPINKKTDDKYVISNSRPVSILNCFSKVYENVIKNELLKSMNVHLSPFLSAYRKNYNTQHVLLRLLEEWREHLDNNKTVGGILMDFSKAFDCVPHDLLLAKLAAYGIDDNLILYRHFYLLNCKQCVCINNIPSEFNKVISGVPQGSIVGPILFNCFFNDFSYFIKNANVHNFTDDNTLTTFAQNVGTLISVLESESKIAIDWFETNMMIVNPGKFQSIIIDKKKQDHTKETFKLGDNVIETSPSVKLLGVQIDDKLNFNLHITNICRSAANQLNALIRFKQFLSFEAKKVLVNSYFYSNFNYCPLVWMLSSAKSLNKIESLQKRALRYLYSGYESPYDTLLAKSGKVTMEASRLRSLCVEIYKSINSINPSF